VKSPRLVRSPSAYATRTQRRRGGEYPLGIKLNISALPALITIGRADVQLAFYSDSRCKIKNFK
jgi:hypothetical protein